MLRILYGIYFLVLFLLCINALSRLTLVDYGKKLGNRLRYFARFVASAIVWPVFLFSSAGWQRLYRMWNDF